MYLLALFISIYTQVVLSQSPDCQVISSVLTVPQTGCTLPYSESETVLDKLIVNGPLTINRLNHIKYKSMETNTDANLNINSMYERIVIEDISDGLCTEQEGYTFMKGYINSPVENAKYDIHKIDNQQILSVAKSPFNIYHGVKVIVSSHSGKTEYAEVDRVEGLKIFLKDSLKNTHLPTKVIAKTSMVDLYPQIIVIDEQRVVFKNNCLKLKFQAPAGVAEPSISGILFQDMKGLSMTSEVLSFSNIIYMNSEGKQSIFYKITAFTIADITMININSSLFFMYKDVNTLLVRWQLLRMKDSYIQISSVATQKTYFESCSFNDNKMRIRFNQKLEYQINNSELMNSEIELATDKDYVMTIHHNFLLSTIFTSKDQIITFTFSANMVAGREINFEKIYFQTANVVDNQVNGEDLKYGLYLDNRNSLSQSITLNINDNKFFNFADKGYSIITSSFKFGDFPGEYLQNFYNNIQYFIYLNRNIFSLAPGSTQKLIYLPYADIWYTEAQGSTQINLVTIDNNLNKITKFIRRNPETTTLVHRPVYEFTNGLAGVFFNLEADNDKFYFDVQAQDINTKWECQKVYLLNEKTIYKGYFKQQNGDLAPAQTIILELQQDTLVNTFNTLNQIKVFFKPTVPIKKISKIYLNQSLVASTVYAKLDPVDGAVNIFTYKSADWEINIIRLEFELCNEGEFLENSVCVASCSGGKIALNNICLDGTQKDGYYLDGGAYKPCLNNNCKQCTTGSDCSTCVLDFKATQLCFEDQYAKIYVQEGGNYVQKSCISNCQKCSDLTTCDVCVEGFALQNDNTCGTCGNGFFLEKQKCVACDPANHCDGCFFNQIGGCKACLPGYSLFQGVCLISCQFNEYLENEQCKPCHNSCLTCSGGNSNNCMSCPNGYKFSSSQCLSSTGCTNLQFITSVNTCQNCFDTTNANGCFGPYPNSISCQPGKFVKTYISGCHSCDTSICSECEFQSNNCTKCIVDFVKTNGKCQKCNEGQYAPIGASQCLQCNDKCTSCTNDKDTCKGCIKGYYLDGSTCKQCDTSCKECDQTGKCTQCNTGSYVKNGVCESCNPLCKECDQQGQCIKCFEGRYLSNGKCEKCDVACSECQTTSTTCTKCPSSKFLFENKCVTECPIKTFQKSSECLKCDSNCKSCSVTKNHCTECESSLFMENNKCVNECSETYEKIGRQCILEVANSDSDSLSPGAVVGIVFGSFICLLLCVVFILVIRRTKILKKVIHKSDSLNSHNHQLQTNQDIESRNQIETRQNIDEKNKLNPQSQNQLKVLQ